MTRSEPRLAIHTSMGSLVVELFDAEAPRFCERFRSLAGQGFYDGTHLHRVNPAIVLGGCPHSIDLASSQMGTGGSPAGPMQDERPTIKRSNTAGTFGLVPGVRAHSCDSQFYFNVKDNPHLDWFAGGFHVVIGQLVEGIDVLRKIAAVRTTGRIAGERPLVPIQVQNILESQLRSS